MIERIPFFKISIYSLFISLPIPIFYITRHISQLPENTTLIGTLFFDLFMFIIIYISVFFIISSIINSIQLNIQDKNIFKKYYLTSSILAVIPGIFLFVIGILMKVILICPFCDEYGIFAMIGLGFALCAVLISVITTSIIHVIKEKKRV